MLRDVDLLRDTIMTTLVQQIIQLLNLLQVTFLMHHGLLLDQLDLCFLAINLGILISDHILQTFDRLLGRL